MAIKRKTRPDGYKDDYPQQVERLLIADYTASDAKIASFFDVLPRSIQRWKHKHPEFAAAIKRGKETLNHELSAKLVELAQGAETWEEKLDSDGHVHTLRKLNLPNFHALAFFLKNRMPDVWQERSEQEITVNHNHGGDLVELAREYARRIEAANRHQGESNAVKLGLEAARRFLQDHGQNPNLIELTPDSVRLSD